MADITLSLVSEPGLAAVDSVAGDAATLRAIAERLAGTWASTGVPVDHEPAGQRAVRGRLHLEVRRPPPGVVRTLPADWVRFHAPPWGGRLGLDKPLCV